MKILDGRATAAQIQEELKVAVQLRKQAGQKIPHLAAILVGNDGGSVSYVTSKVKLAKPLVLKARLSATTKPYPKTSCLKKSKVSIKTAVLMVLSFNCLCPSI
jgi:methylenetetrahydrofolate dehydrogenase (NADP+)/methenyltetrahydrofolate cyclohydrolase